MSFAFSKIGVIGLGNMGFPMARNLAKSGHQVFGFDVDAGKKAACEQNGINFRSDIKSVAKEADIFVTMLPNSQHSKEVCESDGGLFKNAPKGSLIIDSSTISPKVAKELSDKAKQIGFCHIDAPVSGGVGGAEAGTLTFMVGAENQAVFERVKPILQGMGKNFFNCGLAGAGQIAKLANNIQLATQMIGTAEALAMGIALGMDAKTLTKIMSVSTARCHCVDTYNPVPGVMETSPASRNYDRGFACELMHKDVGLAIDAAESVGVKVELGQHSYKIYGELMKQGLSKKDFGVIYDVLKAK